MSRKETVLAIILLISRKDIRETGAPILSGLAVMPLIIGAFFAYWVFVRHEIMALDIVIYVVAMTGAVHLAKIWRDNRFIRDWWLPEGMASGRGNYLASSFSNCPLSPKSIYSSETMPFHTVPSAKSRVSLGFL